MLNKDQGCLCSLYLFPLTPSDLCIVDAQKNEFDGRILREKSKERQSLPSNFQSLLIKAGWTFMSHSLE